MIEDKERLPREVVAMRVAKELPDGGYVCESGNWYTYSRFYFCV